MNESITKVEDLRKDREVVRKLKGEVYQSEGSDFLPYHEPESEPHNIDELKEQTPENNPEQRDNQAVRDGDNAQETTEGRDAQNNDA